MYTMEQLTEKHIWEKFDLKATEREQCQGHRAVRSAASIFALLAIAKKRQASRRIRNLMDISNSLVELEQEADPQTHASFGIEIEYAYVVRSRLIFCVKTCCPGG